MSAIWMALPMLSRTGGDKQAARDVISVPQRGWGQAFIISLFPREMLCVRHRWCTSVYHLLSGLVKVV